MLTMNEISYIVCASNMTLSETLNRTAGRFTTLVVNKGKTNSTYCARIMNATNKSVRFYDVNAEANRTVNTDNIVFARSGRIQYRKPRR
jgi:Leucine-rich repeat (LRR) protein